MSEQETTYSYTDSVASFDPFELSSEHLTSEYLYPLELKHFALTISYEGEQAQALIAKARAGDKVSRDELLSCCLRYVAHVARDYVQRFKLEERYCSIGDLIAEGNLTLVERLDAALASDQPVFYLLKAARVSMLRYCQTYGHSSIKNPLVGRKKPGASHIEQLPPCHVASLDAPLSADRNITLGDILPYDCQVQSQERDYTALYEALDGLSSEAWELITRLYGLCGTSAMKKNEIAEELYPKSKSPLTATRQKEVRAYARLHKQLASVYACA